MDLDITNIDRLWTLLDASGDGELTAEELVKGVARLKGTAKSVDMNHLVGQHDKVVMQMVAELKHVVRTLDLLSGKVNTAVSAINTLSSDRGDGTARGGQNIGSPQWQSEHCSLCNQYIVIRQRRRNC